MCDNFKCYSLNVVYACSIVVHKWVWMLDISPLFLSFYQRSLFRVFNIIFTLVFDLAFGNFVLLRNQLFLNNLNFLLLLKIQLVLLCFYLTNAINSPLLKSPWRILSFTSSNFTSNLLSSPSIALVFSPCKFICRQLIFISSCKPTCWKV